jgi:hypothetical protein
MPAHKHAELIKAWADGAQIQVRNPMSDNWQDCLNNKPSWHLEYEYRIKPVSQTKKCWVVLFKTSDNYWTGTMDSEEDFQEAKSRHTFAKLLAELTYELE